jgi:hypothetical protein
MTPERALAKAAGAAQRAAPSVAGLLALTPSLPLPIARQAVRVIEDLDLLRHYLREETLRHVVEPARKRTAKAR